MATAELLLYFTVTCALFIDKTGILAYYYGVYGVDEDEYLGLSLKESRDGEKPAE